MSENLYNMGEIQKRIKFSKYTLYRYVSFLPIFNFSFIFFRNNDIFFSCFAIAILSAAWKLKYIETSRNQTTPCYELNNNYIVRQTEISDD